MTAFFVRLSALRDLVYKRAVAETALLQVRRTLERFRQGGTHQNWLPAQLNAIVRRYDKHTALAPAKAEEFLNKTFGSNVAAEYRAKTGLSWLTPPRMLEQQVIDASFGAYLSDSSSESANDTFEQWLTRKNTESICRSLAHLLSLRRTPAEHIRPKICPKCGSAFAWCVLPKCHGYNAHTWHDFKIGGAA